MKNEEKERLKMNTAAVDILLQFVAGEIDAKKFENELCTNEELSQLLQDPNLNWTGTYITRNLNLYYYLIELNYSRIEDKANAVEALELFFQRKGITYSKSKKDAELYDLLLTTQPKYIDINSSFFEKYILPTNNNLSKTELKQLIKDNFNRYFKYQSKPPKWIQSPAWIMRDDKPLFFIGQLELKIDTFHDNGFIYIFADIETGEIESVKQFY
jgi:hypothetical protein